MKFIILFSLFNLLFFAKVKSQTTIDDSLIIEKVIDEISPKSIIQILDTVNQKKTISERLKKTILKGKFYTNEDAIFNLETGEKVKEGTSNLIFSLSESEKKYLIKEIAKTTIWNKKVIKNKTIVSQDEKKEGCLLTIIKPIYIRNNSICYVAWGSYGSECGLTGQDFYIRRNKEWIKLYEFSRGNF